MSVLRTIREALLASDALTGFIGDRVYSLADTELNADQSYITTYMVDGDPDYGWRNQRYTTTRTVRLDLFAATGLAQIAMRDEVVRIIEDELGPAEVQSERENPRLAGPTGLYRYTIDIIIVETRSR